jgi:hypothetical protein
MNVKETLKKLHKKFPLMSLDELFEILDCYTENVTPLWWTDTATTQNSKLWYNNGNITATNTELK